MVYWLRAPPLMAHLGKRRLFLLRQRTASSAAKAVEFLSSKSSQVRVRMKTARKDLGISYVVVFRGKY